MKLNGAAKTITLSALSVCAGILGTAITMGVRYGTDRQRLVNTEEVSRENKAELVKVWDAIDRQRSLSETINYKLAALSRGFEDLERNQATVNSDLKQAISLLRAVRRGQDRFDRSSSD